MSWNYIMFLNILGEPCLRRLLQRIDNYLARVDQCQFGLTGTSGQPMRKRSGFLTNHQGIAEKLNVTCDGSHDHETIIGRAPGDPSNRSRMAQAYPSKLIACILRTYAASLGIPQSDLYWVDASTIIAQDQQLWNKFQLNSSSLLPALPVRVGGEESPQVGDALPHRVGEEECLGDWQGNSWRQSECHAMDDPEEETVEVQDEVGSHPLSLPALVKRAHEGLGHPGKDRFLRILKHSKASEQVLKIARELKCSVCERFKRPRPSRAGAPPREVGLNEIVGVDTIQMRASSSQKPKYCLNICDYASHFQLLVPLADHTAQGARQGYRTWIRLFGPPRRLLCDLGREFQKEFEDSAEADGTEILPSSLETPEQRGFVERNGQLFKDMAYKTMEQVNCNNWATWHERIDITCHTKNRLLSRGGFSPAQRVFGYQQRLPGGLMSDGAGDLAVQSRAAAGDLGVNQAMEIRKAASQSFHEIDCQQAIRAAATHGPRPHYDYQPGQAVYFWRRGTDPTRKAANAFWHGPARVVAVQLPTTVWISYNHHLVKAAPEKLRPASEEENLSISGWLDGIGHAKKQFETADIKGMIDLFKEEDKPPVDLDDAQDY